MASELDVTVAVNINSGTVAVTPTGNLTLQNVQALTPVAIRGAALAPDLTLVSGLRTLSGDTPATRRVPEAPRPSADRFRPIGRTSGVVRPGHHGRGPPAPGCQQSRRRGCPLETEPPGRAAPVAQLVEQWTFNPRVVGSIPTGCTRQIPRPAAPFRGRLPDVGGSHDGVSEASGGLPFRAVLRNSPARQAVARRRFYSGGLPGPGPHGCSPLRPMPCAVC